MSPAPKTLLLFGDSNTHGTVPLRVLGQFERYPINLRWPQRLSDTLGSGWRVIDEGLPGRTTVHDDPVEGPHKNGARVLPAILESHRPIDCVVIMLGTNDLKPRFAVGPVDIAQSVAKLIQAVRATSCGPAGDAPAIVVIAPPPIEERGVLHEIFKGGHAKSVDLGKALEAMATREGVTFADLAGRIAVSPVDGIHYEADMMPIIAQIVVEAVMQAMGDQS
ncbi:GDSL-type esterase/lipase family protein [Rhodobacteraceae bacterium XHP0102]|nr:GDSL-type esterase/lipase family protein [Rhodobacteraceae bacterium XHP0102]